MIRSYYLRLLSLLLLFLTVLCGHVLADEELREIGGKGFLSFVYDYFSSEENESSSDVVVLDDPDLEDLTSSDSNVSLMSITPEDVANGVLIFSYQSILDVNGRTVGLVNNISSSTSMNSVRTSALGVVLDDEDPTTYTDTISITSSDVIVDKGEIFDFSLTGITNWWDYKKYTDSGDTTFNCICEDASDIDVSLYFDLKDVGKQLVEPAELFLTVDEDGKHFYLSISISDPIEHDLLGIYVDFKYDVVTAFGMPGDAARNQTTSYADYSCHHTVGFYNSEFVLSIIDQTNGLLGGIIDWLKGIWEGISSLPSKIVDGFKGLFVVSDEDLNDYLEKFDTFFSEHFGFVYQALSTLVDMFDVILHPGDPSVTITFPLVEFEVSEGVMFSFGGYEVDVVPDGLESLVNVLKMIVNIVCTLGMLNVSAIFFDKFLHR